MEIGCYLMLTRESVAVFERDWQSLMRMFQVVYGLGVFIEADDEQEERREKGIAVFREKVRGVQVAERSDSLC